MIAPLIIEIAKRYESIEIGKFREIFVRYYESMSWNERSEMNK